MRTPKSIFPNKSKKLLKIPKQGTYFKELPCFYICLLPVGAFYQLTENEENVINMATSIVILNKE